MATPKTVWGIDVGKCALKALKLRSVEGELRLEAFDIIEHPRILSQPDADADVLTRNALEQFLARNNVSDSMVVASAPGKSGITRFVKLPPVEPKQVPEIVRFEAEQQIPFDINEVIWRWQLFRDPDSPDIEVGIFAMKRPDVAAVLDRFAEVYLTVDMVQMAPLALYNFLEYDGQTSEDGATLLVDIGADKTDLVVADGARIWTRTMQRGGNDFTEALVKGFKLSFHKAEKLKRTAATSKYARQIFQAMRPVFAELAQEIQRSIGYYASLHRDSRFKRVVGLGNGFRLPGLQKYLEQNLGLPVDRVDSFNKLSPSAAVNAPAFTENVLSFAVAYGLALQGLGLTKIQTNLLPSEIARQRLWAHKRPWFVGAAAAILLACAGVAYSGFRDRNALRPESSEALPKVRQVVRAYQGYRQDHANISGGADKAKGETDQYMAMTERNDFWEKLHSIVSRSISKVARHQRLMNQANVERLKAIPRTQRDVIMLTRLYKVDKPDVSGLTWRDLSAGYPGGRTVGRTGAGPQSNMPVYGSGARAPLSGGFDAMRSGSKYSPMGVAQTPRGESAPQEDAPQRGFFLYLEGVTPKQGSDATGFVTKLQQALVEVAKDFPSLEVKLGYAVHIDPDLETTATTEWGGGKAASSQQPTIVPDPLTGEDAGGDKLFAVGWIFGFKDSRPDKASGADRAAAGGG